MNLINQRRKSTETLVLGAVMTALVIVLQLLGTFTAIFGPFATAVGLIPIIIGAAMCGVGVGAWLGFVFGVVVLITNASAFLAISVPGTIVTVLLKGVACGLVAGLVYKLLEKKNKYLAVLAAAIAGPVVNTGIFVLGCFAFFFEALTEWGVGEGYSSTVEYIFLFLVGTNFIVELVTNLILSPVIVRLLDLRKTVTKNK